MIVVSIIMPVHNSAQFISQAMLSVFNQSFQEWELIIVDDCSTDDSVNIIKRHLKKDSRIKLIPLEQNVGASVARNIAIKASIGRYIAFLDSDDMWLPDKLSIQITFMKKYNSKFSFMAYQKIDSNGKFLDNIGVPLSITYCELLKTNVIGCLTAVYDTHYFGKVYIPLETKREDFALWLALLKKSDIAHGINFLASKYRVYNGQSSFKKKKMAIETWKVYRNIEGLGFFDSCYYFCHYAIKGFLRTKVPKLARKLGVLY